MISYLCRWCDCPYTNPDGWPYCSRKCDAEAHGQDYPSPDDLADRP